uniref:dynamin family protein n=1 Tax=Paenirhodobacter enshiensis TaxID=1105367 RepID=UPI0035AFE45B
MTFSIDPIAESPRRRIDTFAGDLAPATAGDEAEAKPLIGRALERLRAASATVSVVGQVKSGKSSLINALTGLGNFLPTEVNPWTAVITNLYFGHPNKPASGGEFQLFSESEWLRMIEGDAETRRLTEELLPGFRRDILERQVLEMQQNAERRLGALYRLLLGKTHRFNEITPEVLERYVSAGYDAETNPGSTAGRFSGITKSASIFLPPGPFRVPVTVSDTPGINDPFLVRDEITTSSFKHADIFVVTLSAHQALGPADVALLKMLSVHRGKRTVIFVNRIDELPDPVKDVPELLGALDARLKDELGQTGYVLLAGSAGWGRMALLGTDAEVAAAVAAPAVAHLAPEGGTARERIYRASGLPQLAACLSQLIEAGPIRAALSDAATECDSALDLMDKLLSARLGKERSHLVDTSDIPNLIAVEKERIDTRLTALSDVGRGLDAVSGHGRNAILANGDVAIVSVSNVVQSTLNAFVQEQVRALGTAMQAEGAPERWSIDIEALCRRVEAQVMSGYRNARIEIDRILMRHAEALNDRIRPIAGEMDVSKILDSLPSDEILPGFKPHSALVEMDFTAQRGWKFWRARTMSAEEAMERLSQIIHAEMRPAVEALNRTVQEALAARNKAAMDRLADLARAAHVLIESEAGALKSDALALTQSGTRERIAQIQAERTRRAEAISARVAVIGAAREALERDFGDLVAAAPAAAGAVPGKV